MQRAVTAGGMLATKHSSLCQKLSPLLRFSLPLSLLHLSSVCVYLVLSLSSLPCYRLPSLLSFSFTIWSFFVTQRCRLLEALPPTHRHTHCNTHTNTHKHRPVTFKTHCPGDVCDDVWHCHGVLCICKHYTLCQNLIWCHPNKKKPSSRRSYYGANKEIRWRCYGGTSQYREELREDVTFPFF